MRSDSGARLLMALPEAEEHTNNVEAFLLSAVVFCRAGAPQVFDTRQRRGGGQMALPLS